jgi:hypothetical protein
MLQNGRQVLQLIGHYLYIGYLFCQKKSTFLVKTMKKMKKMCHFACLCPGFKFYEVKKKSLLFFLKKKMEIPYTFTHFYS